MSIRSLGDPNRHAPWASGREAYLHLWWGRRRHGRPPDRAGVKVGICGEAASHHPDFTETLVENRIESISVNPDRLLEVKAQVAEIEVRRRMAPDS